MMRGPAPGVPDARTSMPRRNAGRPRRASTPRRAGLADRALEVVTGVKVQPLGCDASRARCAARRSLIAAACACNASERFFADHFVGLPREFMRGVCACFSRRCWVSILALKAALRLSASPWSRSCLGAIDAAAAATFLDTASILGWNVHFGGRCFLFSSSFRRTSAARSYKRCAAGSTLCLKAGLGARLGVLRVLCLPRSGALRRGDAAAAAMARS